MNTSNLSLSAVVIHHDGRTDVTLATVGSLAAQSVTPREIIISGEGMMTLPALSSYQANIEYIEAKKNTGRAGAYNAGIGLAINRGAEYILLLQGGLIADKALLSSLQEASSKLGNHVVIGAKIFSEKEPWKVLNGGVCWDYGEYTWAPTRYAESMTEEPLLAAESAEFISGSAMFLPREAVERIGYFDERFSSCFEDIELCTRARNAGFQCMIALKAKVWAQEDQWLPASETPAAAYLRSRNQLLWARKYLRGAERTRFFLGAVRKSIGDEFLSTNFHVPRSDSAGLAKRLYWAGAKYARDVGSKLTDEGARARMRGLRDGIFAGGGTRGGGKPCLPQKVREADHGSYIDRVPVKSGERDKVRILFLSYLFPYPLDCGMHIRVHNIMQALAKAGRVDWIGYTSEGGEGALPSRDDMDKISEICATAQVLSDPPRAGSRGGSLWQMTFSREPVRYTSFPAQLLMHKAAALAEKADLIWVESLHLAHWFSAYGNKMIVDVNDLESVKAERQVRIDPSYLTKWVKRMDVRRLERAEKEALNKYSRLAVCSEHDRNFWPSADERVWAIPNGVADRLFNLPEIPKISNRLVYVGTLDYAPNEDAVVHFCEKILPLIAREVPDVSLCVVGKNPPKSLQSLQDGRQVQLVGRVPDVVPYIKQAAVSIVPLRVGGGTRIKILESLALGTPVVSTTIGAEGLDFEAGRHLLLGDDPESFASAVIRLLNNEVLRRELSVAGKERAKELYGWSGIQGILAERVLDWWGERRLSIATGEKLMVPSSATQHALLMDRVNG